MGERPRRSEETGRRTDGVMTPISLTMSVIWIRRTRVSHLEPYEARADPTNVIRSRVVENRVVPGRFVAHLERFRHLAVYHWSHRRWRDAGGLGRDRVVESWEGKRGGRKA